jgi:Mg/Co/Ni transporter MgtE
MDWSSPWWLFPAIAGSAFGVAYIVYARKAARLVFALTGVAILLLPFFLRTTVALWAGSLAGILLPFLLIRLGIDF